MSKIFFVVITGNYHYRKNETRLPVLPERKDFSVIS